MAEAAGSVKVLLQIDAASYSAALDKAAAKVRKFGQTAEDAGKHTVSSMQASSAAIRVLEGGMTGNIRAAERFIGMLPLVGSALKAAFPLVGGIALAGVFFKIGDEAYQAIKKIEGMSNTVREAFDQMNASAQKSVDSLNLSTDKIQAAIALLEHKPINTAAIALDDARVKADDLAASLNKDYTALRKLLDENQNGILAQILLGKGSTTDVSNAIKDRVANIATLSNQQRDALHPRNPDGSHRDVTDADQASAADLTGKLKAAIDEGIRFANQQTSLRTGRVHYGDNDQLLPGPDANGVSVSYAGVKGNQDVNLQALSGFKSTLENQQDTQEAEASNNAAEVKKTALEAQKKLDAEAASAAQKAFEAQMKFLHDTLDAMKAYQEVTLNDEAKFWMGRAALAKDGSKEYVAAVDEANKAMATQQGENHRASTAFNKTSAEPIPMDLSREATSEMQQQGREAAEWWKNLNQGYALQHENANAMAEASLQMEVATGRMTKLDAAQVQATLHAQEYADAMADLQVALKNAANLPAGFARNAAIAGLNNQVTAAQGVRAVQVKEDQAGVAQNQVGPAIATAVNQMVNEWTNASEQIVGLFRESLNTFNNTVVDILTTRQHRGGVGRQFEQMGHSIFTGATKTTLQAAEGHLGKLLGFGGKAATHVIVDNFPGSSGAVGGLTQTSGAAGKVTGIAGKAVGFLSGLFGGGAQGALSKAQDTSGNLSMLQGIDTSTLPMLAGGGELAANHPAIIGEKGPELWVPRSSGTVVSNGNYGGDTHHYHNYFDARGSDNPAATESAMRRALAASTKQAVNQAVTATREGMRRQPRSMA